MPGKNRNGRIWRFKNFRVFDLHSRNEVALTGDLYDEHVAVRSLPKNFNAVIKLVSQRMFVLPSRIKMNMPALLICKGRE